MEQRRGVRELDDCEFCDCKILNLTKNSIISHWDDFSSSKQVLGHPSKGKKQPTLGRSSRYGYETLEDKYKFVHHENPSLYINDYSNVFLSSNRSKKKSVKSVLAAKALNSLPPRHRESEDDLGEEEIDKPDCTSKSHDKVRVNCTISKSAQLDENKDNIVDESEDDTITESSSHPAEPLVNKLNSFFMSRIQRKQTPSSQIVRKNGFFPYINLSSYRTDTQSVDMTPSSIINYKLPSKSTLQTSNSNSKISTKDFQILTQNLTRQSTQANDLNHMRVTSKTPNQQASTKQSTNEKKFQQLTLRPRDLSRSSAKLALHIKSLTKPNSSGDTGSRSGSQLKPSSSFSSHENETLTQQSLIQNMIDAYRRRGITHPHFSKFEQMKGSQAPKVELFDYSPLYLPTHMRH